MSVREAATQIWRVGDQRIVLGDCLAVMRTILPESIDLIVTSPPYNIGATYNQHDDRQPRKRYLGFIAATFVELHRVLKPDGSFFLNIGTGTKDDSWLPHDVVGAARAAGFALQNSIVWVKSIAINDVTVGHYKPINSDRYLNRTHETVLHLTKTGMVALRRNAIGVPFADKSNIARRGHAEDKHCRGAAWFIDYDTVQRKAEKFDHPAGFPVELPEWCLRLHGVTFETVVLDPFLGVGTTLVAAQALGCQGIGIEIDPIYAETAVQRLSASLVPS
jgi:site-specific DNA-methyltransferase (adenine-specific)